MNSRKPDMRLKVLDKTTNEKFTIGAAWINEDKSITIVLNDMVVLPANRNQIITLFPTS